MIGRGGIRTGIDFGVSAVKLVRGDGFPRLDTVTHVGIEKIEPSEPERMENDAARALDRLLHRLGLRRSQLGAIAVAVKREDASLREVLLPSLSPEELSRALPFEARRHLNLEGMPSPILDFQILGSVPATAEEGERVRVLLAAVSEGHRTLPLEALRRLGLAPEVIDIEPLAGLNALFGARGAETDGRAAGLVDLGASGTRVHVSRRSGYLVSRLAGGAVAAAPGSESFQKELGDLVARIRETLTYYWTRHRIEVDSLHLAGAGALLPDFADTIGAAIGMRVRILDPLGPLDPSARLAGYEPELGPLFVTAVGLCRWWDSDGV